MTQNKRFGLIFSIFVAIPYLLFIFKDNSIDLESQRNNQLNNIFFIITLIGCGYIIFQNKKSEKAISFWYTLPITFTILSLIILFLGNSLSHFGF